MNFVQASVNNRQEIQKTSPSCQVTEEALLYIPGRDSDVYGGGNIGECSGQIGK